MAKRGRVVLGQPSEPEVRLIALVWTEGYGREMTPEQVVRKDGNTEAMLRAVRVDGTCAGFVMYEPQPRENRLYVHAGGVHPNHRNQGVATRVILELRSIAAERHLGYVLVETDEYQEHAHMLFRKLGWESRAVRFHDRQGNVYHQYHFTHDAV